MEHYDFHKEFRSLYDKAVRQYAAGHRQPAEFFSKHELVFRCFQWVAGKQGCLR
jgi:hypothetical protein